MAYGECDDVGQRQLALFGANALPSTTRCVLFVRRQRCGTDVADFGELGLDGAGAVAGEAGNSVLGLALALIGADRGSDC